MFWLSILVMYFMGMGLFNFLIMYMGSRMCFSVDKFMFDNVIWYFSDSKLMSLLSDFLGGKMKMCMIVMMLFFIYCLEEMFSILDYVYCVKNMKNKLEVLIFDILILKKKEKKKIVLWLFYLVIYWIGLVDKVNFVYNYSLIKSWWNL